MPAMATYRVTHPALPPDVAANAAPPTGDGLHSVTATAVS